MFCMYQRSPKEFEWKARTQEHKMVCLFVCVEVLLPSQPSGVMSSAVSLPNHTFTGKT